MSSIILMSLISLGIVTSFSFIYSVKKEFYIIEPGKVKEIQGSENISSKKFEINDFSNINVHSQIKVIYSVGDYKVSAKAEDNILDFISIRKAGNDLDIFLNKDDNQIRNHRPIIVEIQSPEILEINLGEQSEFNSNQKLTQNKLTLSMEQQAIFNGLVELETLEINAEDQSRVNIEGNTKYLELDCENQSSFLGQNFQAEIVKINLSEQSSAQFVSEGKIEGSIRNTSSLDLNGNADISNLLIRDNAKLNQ